MKRSLVPLLLAVLAVAGCGGGDGSVESGGSTTSVVESGSTTTSSASRPPGSRSGPMDRPSTTSTTEPEATTTTPTTADDGGPAVTADPAQCREAGADPGNAEPAALAVFVAWTRDDIACAAELMTSAALGELFSRPGADASDTFQGCFEVEEPDPAIDCAFTYEGGATHYLMNFSDTEGWKVFDITQFAD